MTDIIISHNIDLFFQITLYSAVAKNACSFMLYLHFPMILHGIRVDEVQGQLYLLPLYDVYDVFTLK